MTSRLHTASLLDRLDARAAETPDAVAVQETSGAMLTRRELTVQVRCVAAGLAAAGMKPGDRGLFSVRPGIDALVLTLGVHENGAVTVPLDPAIGNTLFASRLALLEPRWVMAESTVLAASAPWVARLLGWRGMSLVPLASVQGVRFVRTGTWLPGLPPSISLSALTRRSDRPVPHEPSSLASSADAFIVFTSGTTGAPKAVVHSRASLRTILENIERELEISSGDACHTRDLHLVLPALFRGARAVIPRRTRMSPRDTLADLDRFGVTHMFSVPADCQALVDYCVAHRVQLPRRLRLLLVGGAPVYTPFLQRLRAVVSPDTRVLCIYGMTEMLPVARVSMDEKLSWVGEGDLVGELIPGVEGRIHDGSLTLRGPALFSRYLGEAPVATHTTGDLARFDGTKLVLLGRGQDMIIRGDTNIYPALYEPIIERFEGVRRCAMVGVYDERDADERVIVVVEPADGIDAATLEQRLRAALASGRIDIDRCARPDHVLAMPIPLSGRSSKMDKVSLRAIVSERLRCA